MIWLTWRQFRTQALVAAGFLAALVIFAVVLGSRIQHAYQINLNCTGCTLATARQALQSHYHTVVLLLGLLVIVVPALIGAFWGAPLIARELETGTYRMVWTQSVTRIRWLAVKLAVVALIGIAFSGVISLLVGWAAGPYDDLVRDRFQPLNFGMRGIVPLGYAAFGLAVGTAVGLLVRRTIAAMAITIAAFALLQVLVPNYIRPHYQPAVSKQVAVTGELLSSGTGIHASPDGVAIIYSPPGAWILGNEQVLVTAAGDPVSEEAFQRCMTGSPGGDQSCVDAMNLHFTMTYQPANRYWTFQWMEFGGYLLLAGAAAGFLFWRIRRGIS
jgi:hypothetical protein